MEKNTNPKPKNLVAVIVAAVLLLGVAGYFVYAGQVNKNKEPENTKTEVKKDEGNIVSSLKNVFQPGKSFRCNYLVNKDEVVMFVKNNKVRVDGIMMPNDKGELSSGGMINDGEYIYMWTNETKTGMKYSLASLDTDKNEQEAAVNEYQNPKMWAESINKQYKVQCSPTGVSDDKFKEPAGIKFQDFSQMLNDMQEAAEQMEQEGVNPENMQNLEELMEKYKPEE